MSKYILAIDQGSSSTKCLLVDGAGQVVAQGGAPLDSSHPEPGWVDQEPGALWQSVCNAVEVCIEGIDVGLIAGVGISNQRESCVVWDRRTGDALEPVLSWQDQRTVDICNQLQDLEGIVRDKSGLPLDPMFTAPKARWVLDRIDPDRARAKAGEICVGTVDSWLVSRFSGEPVMEAGNASRTQFLNTGKVTWDTDLLEIFNVPEAALPRVVASTGPFPEIRGIPPLPDGLPVLSVLGDSHAALFAHGAFQPGPVKATYGTGSSIMGLVESAADLDPGLCLTIAWMLDEPAFAFEGNIRSSGSTITWVADLFDMSPADVAALAEGASSEGVALVPGFNGLGAPWWDSDAVGLISGLKLGTPKKAVARAAIESIPHQVTDVLDAVVRTTGKVEALHADGGASSNDTLMQLQADYTGTEVLRSSTAELSALGVAHLAGIQAGFWSLEELRGFERPADRFTPEQSGQREWAREAWRKAVERALSSDRAR